MSRKNILGALALALGALLLGSGTSMAAKGFEHLTFMGNYQPRQPVALKVFIPLFKEAENKFAGKLSFDYFGNNSLYPELESFTAVTDGRTDFGTVRPSFFPGQMVLMDVIALPGICPNAIVASLVSEDIIAKFPEVRSEFPEKSVHFTSWASASYQLHTIKPVRTIAELKGLKIITWDSATMEYVKAMGANVIRLGPADTYLALSKGMADGVVCPLAPLRSQKITEAAKHHLLFNLSVSSFINEANADIWNSFPEEYRAWLAEKGGSNLALTIGKCLEDSVKADTEWMKGLNHNFYIPTEAQMNEFLAPLASFTDAWKAEAGKKFKPELVEEVLKFARERSAFHTAEFKAGKYGDYGM